MAPPLNRHASHVSSVANLSLRAGPPRTLEQPLDLGGGLVRGEKDPLALEDQAVDDRSQVLPAEGGAHGARRRVEEHGRRPLVGDSHRVAPAPLSQRRAREELGRGGDRERVVLHLAGVGARRGERELADVAHLAALVDQGGSNG